MTLPQGFSVPNVYVKKYPVIELSFNKKYVDRYWKRKIEDEILRYKQPLADATEENSVFDVKAPSWRSTKDVTIKADIIEEITRIYGYDNFNIAINSALYPVIKSAGNYGDRYTKDILVEKYNLHEVHSYIWCDGKKYKDMGITRLKITLSLSVT